MASRTRSLPRRPRCVSPGARRHRSKIDRCSDGVSVRAGLYDLAGGNAAVGLAATGGFWTVSAMSAAMLSLGERIASELGRGGLSEVQIKGEKGFVILQSLGTEAVLTVLAREGAKMGLVLLDMRRAAEDLAKLV